MQEKIAKCVKTCLTLFTYLKMNIDVTNLKLTFKKVIVLCPDNM